MRTSQEWVQRLNVTLPAKTRIAVGCQRAKHVMPPALYARREDIHPALMRSVALSVRGPQTMLHSDVHPGNWYVTGEGRMGLYDWACITTGGWARDVAYALGTHLPPQDRRAWERDLVARHSERLAERGVRPPSLDDAFRQYSQQMCHPLLMWLATLGLNSIQADSQPADVSLENIRRCTQAAEDLGTLDLV
jgi:thiamine kinase-like enzyme